MSVAVKLSCGRRAPRKRVDLVCRVSPRGGRTRRLRMTELSSAGAWLRTTRPLGDGAQLRLRFTLSGLPFDLRAEVMWSDDRGMALEWLDDSAVLADATAALPDVEGAPSRFSFTDT